MPWPETHHNEGDLDESWFWGDIGEDLSLIKDLDMARGSVATAIHSNERSAVIRLSAEKEYLKRETESFTFDDVGPAAAKEDDGDDNADDDEDRGADPNPDNCLNGQHLDKEDKVWKVGSNSFCSW